jgi:hypothetical protein
VDQQVVGPNRGLALERVVGGNEIGGEPSVILEKGVDQTHRDGVFEDRVAVGFDPGEMRFEVGSRHTAKVAARCARLPG